jgi:hypothetical protein
MHFVAQGAPNPDVSGFGDRVFPRAYFMYNIGELDELAFSGLPGCV